MPLDQTTYTTYVNLINTELVCALGCTEPIALAYSAALAGKVLGCEAEHLTMQCSGNIIKNVKSVAVPNAEGLKGVETASILGLTGGDVAQRLEVLQSVTHEDVERTKRLIDEGFCSVELLADVPNLYIIATAEGHGHTASVTICDRHTNVTAASLDGKRLDVARLVADPDDMVFVDDGTPLDGEPSPDNPAGGAHPETANMTIASICAFADEVDLDDVRETLERQIECNTAISQVGLTGHWGSEIGRTVLSTRPVDVVTRMRARAAAGSDARMGGCSLPVVINSGSGNQGMTVSLPVIEYAETVHASHEQLLRALCISNLTAMHLKHYIGSLSAFCGVVCAAAAAGAAVTYLAGGNVDQIGATVVNTIANVGGIMCDGAKASCAAKIASSVDAAMLGHTMAMLDENFCAGDGLVQADVETTIMSRG